MKIYVVRHAQCLSNRGLKITKHNHLTEAGKEQAKRLGTYFKKAKIDKIFCSTSYRTKETLSYILPYLKNKRVTYTEKIKEHNVGKYYAKDPNFPKKYWADIKKSKKSFYEFKPKDGESYLDLLDRAKKFWNSIKKNKLKSMLLVTHKQFTKCFIINLLGLDISEEKYFSISNASVSTFEIDKNGKIKKFHVNDFNHILEEGIRKNGN